MAQPGEDVVVEEEAVEDRGDTVAEVAEEPTPEPEPEVVAEAEPEPVRTRWLAIDINPPDETTQFNAATQRVRRAKLDATRLSLGWSDLEPKRGQFALGPLDIANAYYPGQGLALALEVIVLDTFSRRLPADLAEVRLDDPRVQERLRRLLGAVLERVGDLEVPFLSLGNQIDLLLKEDESAWRAWSALLAGIQRFVGERKPGLAVMASVRVTAILEATGEHRARLLGRAEDPLLVTYTLLGDLTARPPATVGEDFARLMRLAGGRRVFVTDVSTCSTELCRSSEPLQAEYVRALLRLWQTHDTLVFLHLGQLFDRLPALADALGVEIGDRSKLLREVLRTVGLHTVDGRAKSGWRVVLDRLERR